MGLEVCDEDIRMDGERTQKSKGSDCRAAQDLIVRRMYELMTERAWKSGREVHRGAEHVGWERSQYLKWETEADSWGDWKKMERLD